MQLFAPIIALLGLLSLAAAATITPATDLPATVNGVSGGTLSVTPVTTSDVFSLSSDAEILLNAVCAVTSGGTTKSGSCQVPVNKLNTSGKAGKCDLVNLDLQSLNLNVLGLIVSLPQGLILNVVGNPFNGLLGALLCGLLNPQGLLASLPVAVLQNIVNALNGLFA